MRKSVHSDPQVVFQRLLREARQEAGLTQQAVADHLGRAQSFVAKYEGGERRLDVVEFVQVCRAIGTDPKRLIARLVAQARV